MANIVWWLEKFFHIETFFMIFLIWCLWFVFCRNQGKKTIETSATELLNIFENIDKDPVKIVSKTFSHRQHNNLKKNGEPKKKVYKHEERCREIFESLFDCKFPSCRPDFLKNPLTGRNLELDIFNPTIKTPLGRGLAAEVDGRQHAQFVGRFHNSAKDFVGQVKRDFYKDKVCKERGILLIRIPHHIRYDELDMFIVKELTKYKLV